MDALTELLRARIERDGPLSFAGFMEAALYDPQHGYYGAGRARVGREGDFMTSVSVGPLFGRLLARQFAEMWEILGRPGRFRLTEQGAHDGQLAADVLAGFREFAPECAEAVELCVIEPSATWEAAQRERLEAILPGRVTWAREARELSPEVGVAYSNELLDAFPVHRVRRRGEGWVEMFVTWGDGRFEFTEGALVDAGLVAHLPQDLPEGYTTEARPGVERWLSGTARTISRGWVLVVDYGYEREEYYRPERMDGTLSAYANHRRVDDPLQTPGAIDLTAHVDFTSLLESARAAGLEPAGFTDQQRFIAGLGKLHFEDTTTVSRERAKEQRAFMTLLHPGLLGAAFSAVCFGKGVPARGLTGFHFAKYESTALAAAKRTGER